MPVESLKSVFLGRYLKQVPTSVKAPLLRIKGFLQDKTGVSVGITIPPISVQFSSNPTPERSMCCKVHGMSKLQLLLVSGNIFRLLASQSVTSSGNLPCSIRYVAHQYGQVYKQLLREFVMYLNASDV